MDELRNRVASQVGALVLQILEQQLEIERLKAALAAASVVTLPAKPE